MEAPMAIYSLPPSSPWGRARSIIPWAPDVLRWLTAKESGSPPHPAAFEFEQIEAAITVVDVLRPRFMALLEKGKAKHGFE
jgi:hypothetical protein